VPLKKQSLFVKVGKSKEIMNNAVAPTNINLIANGKDMHKNMESKKLMNSTPANATVITVITNINYHARYM